MPCVQCSLTNSCQIKLKYPAASVFLACDCNNCNCNSSNHCRKLAVANQLGTSTFFLFEFLSGLPAIVGLSADFLSPRQVYSPPWTECLSSPPPQPSAEREARCWGCWVQPVWSAFKGSTASSFVHRTAPDNNGRAVSICMCQAYYRHSLPVHWLCNLGQVISPL